MDALRTVIRDAEIVEKTVEMDEAILINCKLTRCTVIFRGGDTAWMNVSFEKCAVLFLGAAKHVVASLTALGWKPPEMPFPTEPSSAGSGLPN